ncbi:MAG: hypothetical protein ACREKS_20650 [Candidatus Rokuibacteriota bacterium]
MIRFAMIPIVALALLAPPLAAAQPAGKIWRIEAGSAPVNRHFLDAFRQGMSELGYVEGRDIVIEDRWADGRNELFPGLLAPIGESSRA